MPNKIEQAAQQFHTWMQNFQESHKASGHYDDHYAALLDFLIGDGGFEKIENFSEFCQLAQLLNEQKTYSIATPSSLDFDEKLQAYQAYQTSRASDTFDIQMRDTRGIKREKDTRSSPRQDPKAQIERAANEFYIWMEDFENDHQRRGLHDDHKKAVMDYAACSRGKPYIGTYNAFCQFASLVKAKGYNIEIPPCSKEEFEAHKSGLIFNAPIRLDAAVSSFHYWFENSQKDAEAKGQSSNYNSALLEFLSAGPGFNLIRTFEDFCDLIKLMEAHGYSVTAPNAQDFAVAILKFKQTPASYTAYSPTMPAGINFHDAELQLAANEFNQWMHDYKEKIQANGLSDDHNQALTLYAKSFRGSPYVKSYQDLTQLATYVKTKGYQVDIPPCSEDKFSEPHELLGNFTRFHRWPWNVESQKQEADKSNLMQATI